jgi:hypothetical protein
MSTFHTAHSSPSRSGHPVACTCTVCGHVLQAACPHCAAAARPAVPRQTGLRADLITALLVDAVIGASIAEGTGYAARTLCENGVPFDVALRVLTRPASRRHYPITRPQAAPRHDAGATPRSTGVASRAVQPVG